MLTITVPGDEYFDDETQRFVTVGDTTLELEHSLASISKWESMWEKPFLGKAQKTTEETLSYVQIMAGEVDVSELLPKLSEENVAQINDYIVSKQSATWFSDAPGAKQSNEIITSEIIYYWMVSLNVPFECQHWHLNRLLTLIRVINQKNTPAKKMTPAERNAMAQRLNAERRARLKSNG